MAILFLLLAIYLFFFLAIAQPLLLEKCIRKMMVSRSSGYERSDPRSEMVVNTLMKAFVHHLVSWEQHFFLITVDRAQAIDPQLMMNAVPRL
jgi:hypothetical protein